MPGTTKTQTPATTTAPGPDAYVAFADAMRNGYTDTFDAWWASEAGQAAAQAAADQQAAAAKASRLADCRALARDVRDNGSVTAYSRERAVRVLAWLKTLAWDEIPTDAS